MIAGWENWKLPVAITAGIIGGVLILALLALGCVRMVRMFHRKSAYPDHFLQLSNQHTGLKYVSCVRSIPM